MYKSPVEIIYGQMQQQMDGDILRAVQNYGITVDKEELIKALAYDRNQYDKGFQDALDFIVHCKDCIHRDKKGVCEKFRQRYPFFPEDDFYCGFGAKMGRKGDDNG